MLDVNTEICVCNSLTAKDIAECIKENNLRSLKEMLQNQICPMGDKCEACRDEGYHNDGLNLPLILSLVKTKQI
ncbi:(2Fe-2S)-binding protein [Sulfurimonas sp.]|uniref:(2Fe-2S)-binding protein n=1 Tax=Sulfurimonas sp. TaxID=2022749 RepID=UPI00262568EA|nr:(2Fe-2S)-binding protein [Sulfurimonas sp.]